MKTYKELLANKEDYLAHIPKNKSDKNFESLEEHSELVMEYIRQISSEFGLGDIIKRLISSSIEKDATQELNNLIEQLFFESVYFHDFGKVNPNFQNQKMKNSKFEINDFEFGSDHSFPGAVLFIDSFLSTCIEYENLKNAEKLTSVVFLLLFAGQISKHHSPFLTHSLDYVAEKFDFSEIDKKEILNQVFNLTKGVKLNDNSKYWANLAKDKKSGEQSWLQLKLRKFNDLNSKNDIHPFPLFALLKLHYSLLTASDYLATTHYMNQWAEPLSDFGTIKDDLRQRIIQNVRISKEYNKTVFDSIDNYQFTYPQEQSNENLNILRKELSIEVIQNIRRNASEKVFYIEAPTGGGKTNLSMLAAAELLEKNPEINNLYYVFPFTTLITQTYDALKETMGLDEDEIIQLHSKEGFKEKGDGNYGLDKKNHIDYLFLNYPLALLSHVKFFDVLKSNGKEKNYLLHRLANSIVVIDELQSYPPNIWDKLIYLIQNYAEYFNIRFILMSATLPKLDQLSNVVENICHLTNHKKAFFQNPNFCNRVEFDFSLLDWEIPEKEEKLEYLNRLGEFVLERSQVYSRKNDKYPGSVFTIIEFIYKQTATEFHSVMEKLSDGFYDEIFVLSGTILEPRRKEIIHYLKNEENRGKKVILITTQVVEAGVDIDMDLGFKDKSIVDSDEQLAGRINRNVNKPACKLYLFNCDNAEVIYKGDKRFQLLSNELCGLDKEILKSKDFDKLYNSVIGKIEKQNDRKYQVGFSDFESAMQTLNFPEVNDSFRIINQCSSSVFVPINLPVFVPNTENKVRNFTENEMSLLAGYGIATTTDTWVSGEKVFDLYASIVKQEADDFISKKTELKKLQGIMSQFVFSLMAHSKSMNLLLSGSRGEERMGMFYLTHWKDDEIYDFHFGLIEKDEPAIIL